MMGLEYLPVSICMTEIFFRFLLTKVHFNEFGTFHLGRSGIQSEHIMQSLHEDDGKGPGTSWVLGERHNSMAAM